MQQTVKLPLWLQRLVALLGGGGIFVVAFLDSSVLSFPFVTDALVIEGSIQRPARMPYYCTMAAVGSLSGCVWLYLLAKKGGEAFYRRRARGGAERVRGWVRRNAFVSTFVPAILPPPFPFKVFVLADGVFQVPMRTFIIALLVGRGLRYFVEGLLAARYGRVILRFAMSHETMLAATVVLTLAILYVAGRWMSSGPSAHL